MKINVNILKDYINKVSMNGTVRMLDLRFLDTGLKTAVKNHSQTAMAIGFLPMETFEEYESIGELFIKNSLLFMTLLKTFSGVVNIALVGDSMLKISNSKRKTFMVLADEKICDSLLEDKKPNIDYEISFKIKKEVLVRTLDDMKILDVQSAKFVKENNNVSIEIGASKVYDFITNDSVCDELENIEEHYKVEVGVGNGFEDIVRPLSKEVVMKLANDKPITFLDNTDEMQVEFIVAPFGETKD